jgi:transposase-like protein
LWNNAWEEFVPFLDYDVEIGTVFGSINAIESLNAATAGRSKSGAQTGVADMCLTLLS